MSSADHEEGIVDVELAPMGPESAPDAQDDEERRLDVAGSESDEESEFSNDEGIENDVPILTMDELYDQMTERRRRRNTMCVAALLLAIGVAVLKFVSGSGVVVAPLPSGSGQGAGGSGKGAGRRIKFTVDNLNGEAGRSGTFTVQTRPDWAPLGAARFEELTEAEFWSGCRIFRVLPGFVSQWGISGDPAVQAEWDAQPLPDDDVVASNVRGTLSFATDGPMTRTSQVFVNTKDNKRLDKMGFSPFGEVVDGLDVVDLFFWGYGEGAPKGKGPDQGRMEEEGSAYVEKDFPKLSYFTKAEFVN